MIYVLVDLENLGYSWLNLKDIPDNVTLVLIHAKAKASADLDVVKKLLRAKNKVQIIETPDNTVNGADRLILNIANRLRTLTNNVYVISKDKIFTQSLGESRCVETLGKVRANHIAEQQKLNNLFGAILNKALADANIVFTKSQIQTTECFDEVSLLELTTSSARFSEIVEEFHVDTKIS